MKVVHPAEQYKCRVVKYGKVMQPVGVLRIGSRGLGPTSHL